MNDILAALAVKITAALPSWRVVIGPAPQEPRDYLPLVSVAPVRTSFRIRGTGGLRTEIHEINISAMVNLSDYFEDSEGTTVDHLSALVDAMEDRDTDGKPKSTTILGAVNNDLSIGGTVQDILEFNINYDILPTSRVGSATLTILTTRILPNNC